MSTEDEFVISDMIEKIGLSRTLGKYQSEFGPTDFNLEFRRYFQYWIRGGFDMFRIYYSLTKTFYNETENYMGFYISKSRRKVVS